MGNDQYKYRHPGQRPVGVLSGWDKITTQEAAGTVPTGDHQFTIPDLIQVVRSFREEFHPKRLAEIETLIRKHTAREDNPHKLDLSDLNTSVLQELYKLWLAEGYTGTREDFLKVIFQYVKIADIPTTRKGEAYDQVVSVKGLWTVVNDHDKNPDAHEAIWDKLFPGEPVRSIPTFTIKAYLGLPHDAKVKRVGPMHVITPMGTLQEVPENKLEPDYGTGEAAFPVFGKVTNLVEESENFDDKTRFLIRNAKLARNAAVLSIRDDTQPSIALLETMSATPVKHELRYISENIRIQAGTYYTVSLFVSPLGRDCFGIDILDSSGKRSGTFGFHGSKLLPFDQGTFTSATGSSYRSVQFRCSDEKVFINANATNMTGYIYPLYNGWYRLQVTFRANASIPLGVSLYTLDIYDGDAIHEGIEGLGMAVFGLTVTEGPFLPPYIPSLNGRCGFINPTTVEIPVDTWYRNDAGTIVTELSNQAIDCQLTDSCEIYNIANSIVDITAVGRVPIGHNNRAFMAGYNDANATIASNWTKSSKRNWINVVHGYNYSEHLFGGPEGDTIIVPTKRQLNPNGNVLYLGCSRYLSNQLNGYIKSFTFYPEECTVGNIKFFLGE